MNSLNYERIVEGYAKRWLSLLAWGGTIPKAEFLVERYKGGKCLGWASPGTGRVVIQCTGTLAEDLKTVLHELAHLAAPNSEHHGARWKAVYVRAAAEALGVDVDDFDTNVTKQSLDRQVRDAAEIYLAESSGRA